MKLLLFGFSEFNQQAFETQTVQGPTGLFWLSLLGILLLGFFFGVIYTQNQHLFKAYLIKKLDLSDSKFAKRHFDDETRKGLKNGKEK